MEMDFQAGRELCLTVGADMWRATRKTPPTKRRDLPEIRVQKRKGPG